MGIRKLARKPKSSGCFLNEGWLNIVQSVCQQVDHKVSKHSTGSENKLFFIPWERKTVDQEENLAQFRSDQQDATMNTLTQQGFFFIWRVCVTAFYEIGEENGSLTFLMSVHCSFPASNKENRKKWLRFFTGLCSHKKRLLSQETSITYFCLGTMYGWVWMLWLSGWLAHWCY